MSRSITLALFICIVSFGCHVASADEAHDFLKHFRWWEGRMGG